MPQDYTEPDLNKSKFLCQAHLRCSQLHRSEHLWLPFLPLGQSPPEHHWAAATAALTLRSQTWLNCSSSWRAPDWASQQWTGFDHSWSWPGKTSAGKTKELSGGLGGERELGAAGRAAEDTTSARPTAAQRRCAGTGRGPAAPSAPRGTSRPTEEGRAPQRDRGGGGGRAPTASSSALRRRGGLVPRPPPPAPRAGRPGPPARASRLPW